MENTYSPEKFEQKLYEKWEDSGDFATTQGDKTFLITMPPPNVTGNLHIGHALFLSLQDTYTRWKRMLGYNTLWLPGTDHAGIATQVMVERQLEAEGTSRQKLGREAFLKRVWEWKTEYGDNITQQMRAMGASCDWSKELFTMDEKSSRAVRESFSRLFNAGLIYRGERIVNWSSGLQTAISDLEVEQKPVQGALYYLKYTLSDNQNEFLLVATTRPETIFADVAVAVHPEDPRFKKFHGRKVIVPLANREIPIILDEYVDQEFGTGALKITPGHDVNDWKIGQKHKLKTLSCICKDGKLNALAGEFAGKLAYHSRKSIVEALKEAQKFEKEEKHEMQLGYCQRSGVVIEPLISMQWFLKMGPMAKMALKAAEGEDPALRFYPEFWRKTYFEWLNNIEDWCISRQLWWGHQIPAWHCQKCQQVTVPKSYSDPNPTKCIHCGSTEIEQDGDVLDTWYSSGLWPISTLGWPEKTPELEKFYPTLRFDQARNGKEAKALMETGSDILFFWVSRMIMMCTYFMDGVLPFEDIFLHAMVFDKNGQKMSKTKGNVIDPLDVTEKHGADSLRLTLIALSGQGRNVNLDLNRLEGYKAYINKIWNATRFLNFHMKAEDHSNYSFIDKWIFRSLHECIQKVNASLKEYRPDAAFQTLYQFSWYEFCDWYLELFKLQNNATKKAPLLVMESILKLLHPLAPFVTEEIFTSVPDLKSRGNLMHLEYPTSGPKEQASDEEFSLVQDLKEIVSGIRNFRTENKIPPKATITCFLETTETDKWEKISQYVLGLAKIEKVFVNTTIPRGHAGYIKLEKFSLTIPLEGLVDKGAERSRLEQELKKVEADLAFTQKRLDNPNFIQRAKPELVEKEKQIASVYAEKITALQNAINKLGS